MQQAKISIWWHTKFGGDGEGCTPVCALSIACLGSMCSQVVQGATTTPNCCHQMLTDAKKQQLIGAEVLETNVGKMSNFDQEKALAINNLASMELQ